VGEELGDEILLNGLGDGEGSHAREVDVSEVDVSEVDVSEVDDGCDLPHLGERWRVVDVCEVVDKTRLWRLWIYSRMRKLPVLARF
jgi:hypothetical protein